jgi:hypothetical protein
LRHIGVLSIGAPFAATSGEYHDFYVASASVAGALIGLLFVAISVRPERMEDEQETHAHRVRAQAALTAFINALAVSLFALLPDDLLGGTAVVVSIIGLMFVGGTLLSARRTRVAGTNLVRDELFVIGQMAVFVVQLIYGVNLTVHPHDGTARQTISILVIVCMLLGIARAWELIGGPDIGLIHETGVLLRQRRGRAGSAADSSGDGPEPTSDRPPGPWSG